MKAYVGDQAFHAEELLGGRFLETWPRVVDAAVRGGWLDDIHCETEATGPSNEKSPSPR